MNCIKEFHLHFLQAAYIACLSLSLTSALSAQEPIPYGASINLEDAQKLIAGAAVEANKNNWPVAIAVVDGGGHLVAFQKLDNTQLGSIKVALGKAVTSALYRRPTKVFEDAFASGPVGVRVLNLPDALPIEGGLPIIRDGKVIGAVGVSGVSSTEDAQIASAGIKALLGTP